MATEIATRFILRGNQFDPDEITALLGIQPIEVWRYGDLIPRTIMRHKDNGWLLSTESQPLDEENSIDLMRQIDTIVGRLRPHTAKLQEICTRLRLNAKLYCVLSIEGEDRPAIQFDPDTVQWLAQIHAGIDVVTYFEREQ